jgi:hypothetical protein
MLTGKLPISVSTDIIIKDTHTQEILHRGSNAIHPQNMARIIARALANEPNSIIHRIAFGNSGSYIDSASNIIFRPPNTGETDGWQSRLYNEVYSEIVDEENIFFKQDLGSADSSNIRIGGGSSPDDDPAGGGVTSTEVGLKSNITIVCVLNENEPSGQVLTDDLGVTVEENERCFIFDEIGLYSPGKQARNTNGYTNVDIQDKKSTDNSNLATSTAYNMTITVNGVSYSCVVTTPASGTGTMGEITYGDICEGLNTGSWITSGTQINNYVYFYVTDDSEGTYTTIINKQSYGYFTVQSKTTGTSSSVVITCNNNVSDFFYTLTNTICANCNIGSVNGDVAGVQNDPINPSNERERLLTHFIFSPILKSANRSITIEYTLTISISETSDAEINQEIN